MAIFCTKCGAQLADGAKFCLKCGAAQSAPNPAANPSVPPTGYASAPVPPTGYTAAPTGYTATPGGYTAAPVSAYRRPRKELFGGDLSRYAPIALMFVLAGIFFGLFNIVKSSAQFNGEVHFVGNGSLSLFSSLAVLKKTIAASIENYSGYSGYGMSDQLVQMNQLKNTLSGYTVLQVFYTIFLVALILAIVWLLIKMILKKVCLYDFIILTGASFCWAVISLVTLISLSTLDSKLIGIAGSYISSEYAVILPTFAGVFSVILAFFAVAACIVPVFFSKKRYY